MGQLTDFYAAETKKFNVTITYNGSAPDITGDTVKFIMKYRKSDKDANAKIDVDANVANQGANGVAEFTLSIVNTNQTPATYYYDIIWTLSTAEVYVLESSSVDVLQRVYDV